MTDLLVIGYEVERVVFRLALALLVIKLVSEAFGAWVSARRPGTRYARGALPFVTVQVPLRNEIHVAERAIRAVAELDYPRDLLEIQILDDSDDATTEIVDRMVAELRDRVAISVIRRADRNGAKAGALAFAMPLARGELLAIFDADFVPAPDFLRRAVPAFTEPNVGMVQGRWSFPDREASLLHRTQALLLDGLMLVEQPAKCGRGQPLHFNGTAGLWRRACLDDAGGWRADSITEDLELSCRAAQRGWRLVHLADLAVPTELPPSMRAYRTQQQRWSRGNAQVLRRAWWSIARSTLPVRHRAAMLLRPAARSIYVFLAILTFAMPLTTFEWIPWHVHYDVAIDAAMFAIIVAALCLYYVPAHARATGERLRGFALVPAAIALHVGLSLCLAIAFVAGLLRRSAEFVRTPKHGDAAHDEVVYRSPVDPLAYVELAIGCAYVGFAVAAVAQGLFPSSAFFGLWGISHLWVGAATVTGVERGHSAIERSTYEPPTRRMASTLVE